MSKKNNNYVNKNVKMSVTKENIETTPLDEEVELQDEVIEEVQPQEEIPEEVVANEVHETVHEEIPLTPPSEEKTVVVEPKKRTIADLSTWELRIYKRTGIIPN